MFSQDFQEFLELLTKHGADFMVIGGYAYSLNLSTTLPSSLLEQGLIQVRF